MRTQPITGMRTGAMENKAIKRTLLFLLGLRLLLLL